MKKKIIIPAIVLIALVVFLAMSCKVIDKGTESLYTNVVEFDASANSKDDWSLVSAEITEKAKDVSELDLGNLGAGTPITIKGTVADYVSKANGKKNSLVVTPDGYTGDAIISVQIGSIYSGTAVRDAQTLKAFGDFTNQTEWSQYAKALNSELDEKIVLPLSLDETAKGKQIELTGVATASGNEVTVTPIAMTIK